MPGQLPQRPAALPAEEPGLEREGSGALGMFISKYFGYCWEGGLPNAGDTSVPR